MTQTSRPIDVQIIDAISKFPPAQATSLLAIRKSCLGILSGAVEAVPWGMPMKLLRRIVTLRLEQINSSYPRANGKTRRYFSNGFNEYIGTIRDGQMHGSWEWFRRDGTIKRSGKFKAGDPVGDWITYDTTGQPYKVTQK